MTAACDRRSANEIPPALAGSVRRAGAHWLPQGKKGASPQQSNPRPGLTNLVALHVCFPNSTRTADVAVSHPPRQKRHAPPPGPGPWFAAPGSQEARRAWVGGGKGPRSFATTYCTSCVLYVQSQRPARWRCNVQSDTTGPKAHTARAPVQRLVVRRTGTVVDAFSIRRSHRRPAFRLLLCARSTPASAAYTTTIHVLHARLTISHPGKHGHVHYLTASSIQRPSCVVIHEHPKRSTYVFGGRNPAAGRAHTIPRLWPPGARSLPFRHHVRC